MKNLIENINNSQVRAEKEEFIKELFNKKAVLANFVINHV